MNLKNTIISNPNAGGGDRGNDVIHGDTNLQNQNQPQQNIEIPNNPAPIHGQEPEVVANNLQNRALIAAENPVVGIGQPVVGAGQSVVGAGQPVVGAGQPAIEIGQPAPQPQLSQVLPAANAISQSNNAKIRHFTTGNQRVNRLIESFDNSPALLARLRILYQIIDLNIGNAKKEDRSAAVSHMLPQILAQFKEFGESKNFADLPKSFFCRATFTVLSYVFLHDHENTTLVALIDETTNRMLTLMPEFAGQPNKDSLFSDGPLNRSSYFISEFPKIFAELITKVLDLLITEQKKGEEVVRSVMKQVLAYLSKFVSKMVDLRIRIVMLAGIVCECRYIYSRYAPKDAALHTKVKTISSKMAITAAAKNVFFKIVLDEFNFLFSATANSSKSSGGMLVSEGIYYDVLAAIMVMLFESNDKEFIGRVQNFYAHFLDNFKILRNSEAFKVGRLGRFPQVSMAIVEYAVDMAYGYDFKTTVPILERFCNFIGQFTSAVDCTLEDWEAIHTLMVLVESTYLATNNGGTTAAVLSPIVALMVRSFERHSAFSLKVILRIISNIASASERNAQIRTIAMDALREISSVEKLKLLFAATNYAKSLVQHTVFSLLRFLLDFHVNNDPIGKFARIIKINERIKKEAELQPNVPPPEYLNAFSYVHPELTSNEAVEMFRFFGYLVVAMATNYPDWTNDQELLKSMKDMLGCLGSRLRAMDKEQKGQLISILGKIFATLKILLYFVDKSDLMNAVAGDSELSQAMFDLLWPGSGGTSLQNQGPKD
jgi:hypothetical protein